LVLRTIAVQGKVQSIAHCAVSTSYSPRKTEIAVYLDETMTSPLEPSTEIPSSVLEDTVVGDTTVIAAATNNAAVEALTEEMFAEVSHAAATSTATSEEKEEETAIAKKKRRVTGEKRTRRVGIPSPRKDAKLEDPSQAGRDVHDNAYKVQSKHDEKWNKMLEALVEYKKEQNSTMVPQCYDQDQRLGRWVHYQRVEYWIYQTSGKGKINADRIARLEALGFEVRTVGFAGLLAVLFAFGLGDSSCITTPSVSNVVFSFFFAVGSATGTVEYHVRKAAGICQG
jgi:hypothetical protein